MHRSSFVCEAGARPVLFPPPGLNGSSNAAGDKYNFQTPLGEVAMRPAPGLGGQWLSTSSSSGFESRKPWFDAEVYRTGYEDHLMMRGSCQAGDDSRRQSLAPFSETRSRYACDEPFKFRDDQFMGDTEELVDLHPMEQRRRGMELLAMLSDGPLAGSAFVMGSASSTPERDSGHGGRASRMPPPPPPPRSSRYGQLTPGQCHAL
eukprot:TRINITY_DN54321_c0_g1_i1.p1 TRINITY_DN54321_c0_g1~~TRINITY_DN54321_c0_g1_i1.p1  ORF type:complete len:205 (-),score=19.51 TRINITY_DN54321_c0_g1_i1:66-680(-)